MRSQPSLLRWISIGLLLATMILALFELVLYSRERTAIPKGVDIGGIPVGGLTIEQASQTLLQTYNQPIEVQINTSTVYIIPAQVGFTLNLDGMMAAVDSYRTSIPFWEGFWRYLWNIPYPEYSIPLVSDYSRSDLKSVITDLAARYDTPPIPPQPKPGTPFFSPGKAGIVLNQDRAAELLAAQLTSNNDRLVTFPVNTNQQSLPSLSTLETLIKQITQVDSFTGVADVYMVNLQNGQDLHVVQSGGQDIPKDPDVAFSAASVMKIEVLLSTYLNLKGDPDAETLQWLSDMLTLSQNPPADLLMQQLNQNLGPLKVTNYLSQLGLENSFIAGYFADNSPLLEHFYTPANKRTDVETNPDIYNQTTPTDIGLLLQDFYQCSQGGGTLLLVFPDQMSPEKCDAMINWLSQDKLGALIEAGVPEGTKVAHKHGWTAIIDTIGDAAIVYTPGGNYVLTVFLYEPEGYFWDQGSKTIADISKAVYNYFNPPTS